MEPEEELKPQENPESAEPVLDSQPAESEAIPTTEPVVEPAAEVMPEAAAAVEPEVQTEVKAEPLRAPAGKKTFWSKALPWVIVALLFYLGGVATIYFAVHQPAKKAAAAAAATAEQEISSLNNQVSQLELQKSQVQSELDTARGNLVDTQEELTAAQSTIEEQLTEVANANIKRLVYKLLGSINSARASLEKRDTASARQALNFAKADLEELEGAGLAAEALSGFADRLEDAVTNLNELTLQKSRAALDTLYTNLLLLVDNLP
ncbi:MAG TPA: hypothetical protein PKK59_10375 [Anaerolineaceae bacterium]|nr:hypothetical protein [Anaerolineaceae bacterium]